MHRIMLPTLVYLLLFLAWSGPSALCLLAPECGSWGRVCRGTTLRSPLNPLGFGYAFVEEANLVIARLGTSVW